MLTQTEAANLLGVAPEWIRERLSHWRAASEGAGAGASESGCPFPFMQQLLQERQARYQRVIATVGVQKGGVGKSFLAVNLAVCLAREGCRTLLIDLDPQACSTYLLAPENVDSAAGKTVLEACIEPSGSLKACIMPSAYEGLDLAPCRETARQLHRVSSPGDPAGFFSARLAELTEYDCILFDVPPAFSDIVVGAYLASALVLMPALSDVWSLEAVDFTLTDLRRECERWHRKLPECRVVLNRFSGNRNASMAARGDLLERHPELLSPVTIRDTAAVPNALNLGISIFRMSGVAPLRAEVTALARSVCPLVTDAAPAQQPAQAGL